MRFFDSHCHIQDEAFTNDLEGVIRRASDAGVERMLCCGTEESDWPRVLDLAGKYPVVKPAVGLHPICAARADSGWLERLRTNLRLVPAAVGEVGLDAAVEKPDMSEQEQMLRDQLAVAADMSRPVSLHCRRAWGRLVDLLKSIRLPERGVVIHSYSGSPDLVAELVRIGPVYFSFSGSITRPSNRRGRASLPCVPADRLLIETDAPDIPPILDDGSESARPNEPSRLPIVAKAVATVLGENVEQIAAVTWRNACLVFGD